MTATTPVYALPYPEDTDDPDVPSDVHALALAVEGQIVAMDTRVDALEAPATQKVFTATGSLTAADVLGARAIRIRGVSGGGSGGGAAANAAGNSSTGGGGQYGHAFDFVSTVASLTFPLAITIPAAATGGAGVVGVTGGTLTIVQNGGAGATLLSMTGGTGGALGTTGLGVPFAILGGAGAPVATIPATGVTIAGMPGALGERIVAGGGYAGEGGSGLYGGGGVASGGNTNGGNALGFGGGGGGGAQVASGAATSGGTAGKGIVIVELIP